MRRLLLLVFVLACGQTAPSRTVPAPPPTGVTTVVADAAVALDAPLVTVADAGPPPPPYRTAESDYDVDPALAGTGKTFLVESANAYATKVGQTVLATGGNAVDAAVATAFTLAVTHPTAGNLGGGGFAVVRTGKGKVRALDFRETAPAKATANMYTSATDSLLGAKASGVPGSVAGLWALHKKWGTKKWKDLIAPAIELAKTGYQVGPYLHRSIGFRQATLGLSGPFADMFAPGGVPVAVGATVKNPELAEVLELVAKKGPDGFYRGTVAKAIETEMARAGGLITRKDLAGYKAVWRDPITVEYRGKKLYTMPLPSSGGVVLAMTANMLRGQDLAKLGWHSAAHVHWLVEVWRRGYAARNELLGDPAYVKDMPVKKLVSQPEGDRLAKTITERATPSKDVPALLGGTHTTHLSVVDAKGMAVALTTTLNTSFGSGFMIKGVLMNNEMDDFATRPGQPNAYGLVQGAANKIEPGKRMLSSMSPTIIEDDQGELYMVVGAQGGARIITSVWQTISNVIDFGLPVAAAIAAPRVHHQHLPDDIVFDDEAISKAAADELAARGHKLVWRAPERIFAAAGAIVRTPTGWAGAADPRSDGLALGD